MFCIAKCVQSYDWLLGKAKCNTFRVMIRCFIMLNVCTIMIGCCVKLNVIRVEL